MSAMSPTAAALVIGNELLTGKIQDMNVEVLATTLFRLGVSLRRVVICPDERAAIVADVRALSAAHDWLFTSGGIGVTHDDVTMAAVAEALGRPLERSPHLAQLVTSHFGPECTPRHLQLADVPRDAELVSDGSSAWPVVRVENVYVLPGIPQLFDRKLRMISSQLAGRPPFVSRAVLTLCDEVGIADLLDSVVTRYPDVAIGSYPELANARYTLRLTFDGRDARRVDDAAQHFVSEIPQDRLVDSGVPLSDANGPKAE
jgi:molybdenum cofactor synthesis domain-containing protein